MGIEFSDYDKRKLIRLANEPFFWVRENIPEAKKWDDEFFDLVDLLKSIWQDSRLERINLCFVLKFDLSDIVQEASVNDYEKLQAKQNRHNSNLIFEIDLYGKVLREIDVGQEIENNLVRLFSEQQRCVAVWFGPDFQIYCNGQLWDPRNKKEILRDIKSKRRDKLLSMENYRQVLETHYEQYIYGEARTTYWLVKDKVLFPSPERIFQKSLWDFLNREVDCIADMQPMFKDQSRCDVRIFLDNYDLYFIEIKWVGFCAKRLEGSHVITGDTPTEFGPEKAIEGAYQTKIYIESNNAIEFDHRIRLGILLVYDGYPICRTPLRYGKEIEEYPLIEIVEFALVTPSPSKAARGAATRRGLS